MAELGNCPEKVAHEQDVQFGHDLAAELVQIKVDLFDGVELVVRQGGPVQVEVPPELVVADESVWREVCSPSLVDEAPLNRNFRKGHEFPCGMLIPEQHYSKNTKKVNVTGEKLENRTF